VTEKFVCNLWAYAQVCHVLESKHITRQLYEKH